MDSFEELELAPDLVEALASEGIEIPTAMQAQAIPVLRRGTSAVLRAAPGAGLLVTYGAPLLDRLATECGQPAAIILTAERTRVRALALSLSRMAVTTGHRVGALGVPWHEPGQTDILFSTLRDLEQAVSSATVKIEGVESLVMDGAEALLEEATQNEHLGSLLQLLTKEEPQITVVNDPLTPEVRRWIDEHVRRGVFLPAEAVGDVSSASPIERGTLRVRILEEDLELVLPSVVSELLGQGHEHPLIFARSDDRAADLGDLIALHGFDVGRPGESQHAVWLGVDPLEARAAVPDPDRRSLAVVSADVPTDADELDRRHGGSSTTGTVIALPHELPHLRRAAREAGYMLEPVISGQQSVREETDRFLTRLEAAIEEEDLLPYLALLEPILQRRGAVEVAAALAALLRKAGRPQGKREVEYAGEEATTASAPPLRPPAWARLFMSIGRRDGVSAGDLLGAIAGEAAVDGNQVGRIDVRESFSKVEVHDSVAQRVIRSLNGTSIRGRSVRVDFDRVEDRTQERAGSRKRATARRNRDRST